MTSRLARWLFRRFVEKRIIGYIVYPMNGSVYPGEILPPLYVEVVFSE